MIGFGFNFKMFKFEFFFSNRPRSDPQPTESNSKTLRSRPVGYTSRVLIYYIKTGWVQNFQFRSEPRPIDKPSHVHCTWEGYRPKVCLSGRVYVIICDSEGFHSQTKKIEEAKKKKSCQVSILHVFWLKPLLKSRKWCPMILSTFFFFEGIVIPF